MIRHLFATPGDPVRLAKPAADAAESGLLTESAVNWWVMIPTILVGIATILTVQLRISRARRLPPEERAFRALTKKMRVPTRFRVLIRRLAREPDAPPPVAMLMSDNALSIAAGRIEAKPKSPTDRVLSEYLSVRGVRDPRASGRASVDTAA